MAHLELFHWILFTSTFRLCIWYTEPERKNQFLPFYQYPWFLHPSGRRVQWVCLVLCPFCPLVLSSWRRAFVPQLLSPRALWPSGPTSRLQTPSGAPAQVVVSAQHHSWYTHTHFLVLHDLKKQLTKSCRIDHFWLFYIVIEESFIIYIYGRFQSLLHLRPCKRLYKHFGLPTFTLSRQSSFKSVWSLCCAWRSSTGTLT